MSDLLDNATLSYRIVYNTGHSEYTKSYAVSESSMCFIVHEKCEYMWKPNTHLSSARKYTTHVGFRNLKQEPSSQGIYSNAECTTPNL